MVGAAQVAAVFLALASAAAAQEFRVDGSCRDGLAHGSYELRDGQGTVRAVGAFNRGKRTGSFLFWSAAGAREAQLPFDEDVMSGTAALWWPSAASAEPKPRVEAAYLRGKRSGATRTWYASGKPQAELTYDEGQLRAARAAAESGKPMTEPEARALAAREAAAADARIAALLAMVDAHLPRCDPASDRLEKS